MPYQPEEVEFPHVQHTGARPVTDEETDQENRTGFTSKDLYRRVDVKPIPFADDKMLFYPYKRTPQFEFSPRSYKLVICGLNSYRWTNMPNHDEDSAFWEIP